MNALLYLTHNDFKVKQTHNGSTLLCHEIQGLTLILFYSTACHYCQQIIPVFKTLPGRINGCQFGLVNISTSKPVVGMSKQTSHPIKYVPLIIIYVNGMPFYEYRDEYSVEKIVSFIQNVASKIPRPQFSSNSNQRQQQQEQKRGKFQPRRQPYCEGLPVFGDKKDMVCYLPECDAYPEKR